MKKAHWTLLFLILSLPVIGQKRSDYGVFAGVSSYIGDINPNRLLYSPLPAAGLFYRFNFNPRQALRGNLFVGGLRGNDLDFNNDFQLARGKSFSGIAGEFSVQYEFNFFPYSSDGKRWDYTPYIAGGAGVAAITTEGFNVLPVIPFSAGFKINILKNLGLEAEYSFRKTFYDNFDGLKDLVDPADFALIHNNDWYSFTGISFTWKIMSRLAGCPAYDDANSNRKR
jgi:hypothetical protein